MAYSGFMHAFIFVCKVCMHVCVHVHDVCTHMCVCIWVSECVYACIHVCTCMLRMYMYLCATYTFAMHHSISMCIYSCDYGNRNLCYPVRQQHASIHVWHMQLVQVCILRILFNLTKWHTYKFYLRLMVCMYTAKTCSTIHDHILAMALKASKDIQTFVKVCTRQIYQRTTFKKKKVWHVLQSLLKHKTVPSGARIHAYLSHAFDAKIWIHAWTVNAYIHTKKKLDVLYWRNSQCQWFIHATTHVPQWIYRWSIYA